MFFLVLMLLCLKDWENLLMIHQIQTLIKVADINGTPKLGLFALTDIAVGQEIRYDYGQLTNAWWRKKVWTLTSIPNKPYTHLSSCGFLLLNHSNSVAKILSKRLSMIYFIFVLTFCLPYC